MSLRALFQIDPAVTFLNHGSFGACPLPVFATYQAWQSQLERQPVEFIGRRHSELIATARTALAMFVKCDPADLVFVPNATHGVNIVAHSLKLQPGDEVIGSNHEYGAAERTWRFICQQRGAVYRTIDLPEPLDDPQAIVATLMQAVTPRTRVLFLSHITSPTALTFPVAEICRQARERGILTVIDGAHGPGQVPLHMETIGADFYTGNCHKWLMAPKGAAFLYARRECQDLLDPLIVSWGYESRTPSDSRFQDLFTFTGTADPAAYLSVPAAIAFQDQYHWDQVRETCHDIVRQARTEISAITGMAPLAPDSSDWYSQMCAIPLPADAPDDLQQRLYAEDHIEIPVTEWQGRRLIRISIQGYNTRADLDHLLTALHRLLGR